MWWSVVRVHTELGKSKVITFYVIFEHSNGYFYDSYLLAIHIFNLKYNSGDRCQLVSTLCKYDLRKGDLFVLSWARVQ